MYNAKQQKAILDYIAENTDSYITVNQISEYMKSQHIKIGLTTIYRHPEKLIEQGLISKIKVDGLNGACFKYGQPEEKAYFTVYAGHAAYPPHSNVYSKISRLETI